MYSTKHRMISQIMQICILNNSCRNNSKYHTSSRRNVIGHIATPTRPMSHSHLRNLILSHRWRFDVTPRDPMGTPLSWLHHPGTTGLGCLTDRETQGARYQSLTVSALFIAPRPPAAQYLIATTCWATVVFRCRCRCRYRQTNSRDLPTTQTRQDVLESPGMV